MYGPFLGQAAQITGSNGIPVSIDANGYANISESDVLAMMKQGFLLAVGGGGGMPESRHTVYTANANGTLYANSMAYGKFVTVVGSGGANVTLTTETGANIIAVIPGAKLYDSWRTRLINVNSGNITVAPGANVTIKDANGNAASSVVGSNKMVDYHAYIDSSGNVTYWEIGRGNAV
jgi:hypothetical protein